MSFILTLYFNHTDFYIYLDKTVQFIMAKATLGTYIRNQRTLKGLSLRELATSLDIDVSFLSKIERDERTLSMDLVPSLAKALDVQFKDLQTDILAMSVLQEYGNEEYALEGFKKALKNITV